jgi:hypothetical protein
MNIQRIFDTLRDDMENSALGIICTELETQGYSVIIDNVPVKAEYIIDGKHVDIENKRGPLDFTLLKSGAVEQEFSIEFVDFHEVLFERKSARTLSKSEIALRDIEDSYDIKNISEDMFNEMREEKEDFDTFDFYWRRISLGLISRGFDTAEVKVLEGLVQKRVEELFDNLDE